MDAALRAVEGVTAVAVDRAAGRARVDHEAGTEAARLVAAVDALPRYGARLQDGGEAPVRPAVAAPKKSLYPLFLIVGFLLGVVLLVAQAGGVWRWHVLLRHFMGGFFLTFAFFKLLDLRGFVTAFRDYDLLAKGIPGWAWAYPFVEVALGASYLLDAAPMPTNVVTLVVMGAGALGVLQALRAKREIPCACLGTALDLPMTTVTLVEDLTMAGMALVMLGCG